MEWTEPSQQQNQEKRTVRGPHRKQNDGLLQLVDPVVHDQETTPEKKTEPQNNNFYLLYYFTSITN